MRGEEDEREEERIVRKEERERKEERDTLLTSDDFGGGGCSGVAVPGQEGARRVRRRGHTGPVSRLRNRSWSW